MMNGWGTVEEYIMLIMMDYIQSLTPILLQPTADRLVLFFSFARHFVLLERKWGTKCTTAYNYIIRQDKCNIKEEKITKPL